MNTHHHTLLMTSAIRSPAAFQAIIDPHARLLQALCSLLRWIHTASFQTIILCDGTDPDYDFSAITAYAADHGKKLEILLFRESDAYLTHGKSYAEGEVLAFALKHSSHLNDDETFFKVTGRTFVENADALCALHVNDNVVFSGPASLFMPAATPRDVYGPASVWTQFYKCDVRTFRMHLMEAYTDTDDVQNPIECEYHRRLQHVPHVPFAQKPFIVGRNGGLNLPYDADFDEKTIALAESFL